MINTLWQVRDGILELLNNTYGPPEVQGKDWYYCQSWLQRNNSYAVQANMNITVDILALIAFAHCFAEHSVRAEYYGQTLFNEILNMIWTTWAGGTTAEVCTERICDFLNIEK